MYFNFQGVLLLCAMVSAKTIKGWMGEGQQESQQEGQHAVSTSTGLHFVVKPDRGSIKSAIYF